MSHPLDEEVAEGLRAKGWEVLTRGWPDLMCIAETRVGVRIMAVELKRGKDRLSPHQERMAQIFNLCGIKHFVVRDSEMTALEQLQKKRGTPKKYRAILPGEELERLVNRASALEAQLDDIKGGIARLTTEIGECSTLFDFSLPHLEPAAEVAYEASSEAVTELVNRTNRYFAVMNGRKGFDV